MTGNPDDALDACVRCGFCLPACPTYDVLRGELDSPRGRIALARAVETGRAENSDTARRHLDRCLGCRACEAACPSGVPYGEILESARVRLAAEPGAPAPPWPARLLLAAFKSPARTRWLMRAIWTARRTGLMTLGSEVSRTVAAAAETAPPARWTAHSCRSDRVLAAQGTRRGRVALLPGCVMDHGFGDVQAATCRLLAACGFEVHVPQGPLCCGALHAHAGRLDDARALVSRLAAAVGDADVLVTNAAGCGSHLKEAPGPLAGRVRDALELIEEAGLPDGLQPIARTFAPGKTTLRVAYDAPCHLEHAQGISDAPRSLLGSLPDVQMVALAGSDRCCGGAGTYALTQPRLSRTLRDEKIAAIRASGADVVATANPGCQLQIAAGIRAAGLRVRTEHVVTLLAAALPVRPA